MSDSSQPADEPGTAEHDPLRSAIRAVVENLVRPHEADAPEG